MYTYMNYCILIINNEYFCTLVMARCLQCKKKREDERSKMFEGPGGVVQSNLPTTAFMRLTPAAELSSFFILNPWISPVLDTWGPPQSSQDTSPME